MTKATFDALQQQHDDVTLATRFATLTPKDTDFARYMLVMCQLLKHDSPKESLTVEMMATEGFSPIEVSEIVTRIAWDLGVDVTDLNVDDVTKGPWVFDNNAETGPHLATVMPESPAAIVADVQVFLELCHLKLDDEVVVVFQPPTHAIAHGDVYGSAITAATNYPSLTFCGPSIAETTTTEPLQLLEFGTLNRLCHAVDDPSLRQELQMMVCLRKRVSMTAEEMAQWIYGRICCGTGTGTGSDADTDADVATTTETNTASSLVEAESEFRLSELDVDNDKRMWNMMLAALDTLTV